MSGLMKLRNTEVVVYPDEPIQIVKQQESKPGKGVATLELTNDSSSIARFTVSLGWTSFVPQTEWIRISEVEEDSHHVDAAALQASHYDTGTRTLTTYLGRYSKKLVNVSFNVPKNATARAGRYELEITVEKKTKQGEVSEDRVQTEKLSLLIQPFYDNVLSAEVVTPLQMSRSFRRTKRYQVTISSRANDWTYFKIVHGGQPNFQTFCDQEVLAVPPGMANGPQTRSFWISAKYKPAKKGHFFYGPDELNKEVPLSINRIDAPSVLRFNLNYERDLECDARYVSSKGFNPPESLSLEKKALMSFLPAIPMGGVAFWQRVLSAVRSFGARIVMLGALCVMLAFLYERLFRLADMRLTVDSGTLEGCSGKPEELCIDDRGFISFEGAGAKGAIIKGYVNGRAFDFPPPYVPKPADASPSTSRISDRAAGMSRSLRFDPERARRQAVNFAVADIFKAAKVPESQPLRIEKVVVHRSVLWMPAIGAIWPRVFDQPINIGDQPVAKISFIPSTDKVEWDQGEAEIELDAEPGNGFGEKRGQVTIGTVDIKDLTWTPEKISFTLKEGDVFAGRQRVKVTTAQSSVGTAFIEFPRPEGPPPDKILVSVCSETGKIPGPNCPEEMREFQPGSEPKVVCTTQHRSDPPPNPILVEVEVCKETGQLAGASCPKELKRFREGSQPVAQCDVHNEKPAPLEEGIYTRFIDALMKGNEKRAVQLMQGSKSSFKDPLLAFAYAASGDIGMAESLLSGADSSSSVQELFFGIAEALVLSTKGDEQRKNAESIFISSSNVRINDMPVGASWPFVARAYFFKDRESQRKGALNRASQAAASRAEKSMIESLK